MKASRLFVTLCTAVLFALPVITQAQEKVRIIGLYDKCVVYPPAVVILQKGGTIEFRAVETYAVVILPKLLLSPKDTVQKTQTFEIPAGGKTIIKIPENVTPGVYPYVVVCPHGKKFSIGEGFSGPIIIIE